MTYMPRMHPSSEAVGAPGWRLAAQRRQRAHGPTPPAIRAAAGRQRGTARCSGPCRPPARRREREGAGGA